VKASDFISCYVEAAGVTHVFELAGGMITHLLDSFSQKTQVVIVSCHHEQAAAFAAEGYARISGSPGIALATSGPGATNLLTAIASCYFDSTPAVFITGQVNTHELKGGRPIRQLGFQETDIVAMATPICKSAVLVLDVEDLPAAIDSAFKTALDGRMGPCLLDVPMDIQSQVIDDVVADQWLTQARSCRSFSKANKDLFVDNDKLKQQLLKLLTVIQLAKRPLLLMGGGCATVSNRSAARQIVDLLGVPVVLSLMAVDVLPSLHPMRVGFIGSYGNRWANKVLGSADLLVVIGSRLDVRQTGSDLESFCAGKQIWQIDIDGSEIGVRIKPQHAVYCPIQAAADQLAALTDPLPPKSLDWLPQIDALRCQFPAVDEYVSHPGEVNPIQLLTELSGCAIRPCHYVTDVGQHQMWAAQSLRFRCEDRFITSGGMGAMGFGLPAAIGVAISNPEVLPILISGDGSFQLNIQELQTVIRNRLNLKIILFNNQCHGMVRQFQETYFDGRLQSTVDGYTAPDFVAIATAYGIKAIRLSLGDALDDCLCSLLDSDGPALLEVPLSIHSKVYPKLAFGRSFGEMEPDASPIAMEST
jgi:acetolactate synthase-1/2/3 large subunit